MSCNQLSSQTPDPRENVFTLPPSRSAALAVSCFLSYVQRQGSRGTGWGVQGTSALWLSDTHTQAANMPSR